MKERVRAFGYLRVSGKAQVDGDGLVRQEAAIRQYAEANGYEIAKFYRDEGVSGTKESRPALAEMMVSLEQNGHGVTTAIIEKVDRLARDLMVQEAIIHDFQQQGFKLISVHEGPDLLSDDPTRKLMRQFMGAIAEYDKTMIVLKLRAARDRIRAKQGKCEGQKGYTEKLPDLIEEIKKLRRKTKGQPRRTYVQVAEELNRQGLKTMKGGCFTGQTIQDILRRAKG